MKYMLKFRDNWADEMNIDGFVLVDEKTKDEYLHMIEEQFKNGGEVGFGTNEYNHYDSLEHVMSKITIKELTEEEYAVFKKFLGSYGYGNFPFG